METLLASTLGYASIPKALLPQSLMLGLVGSLGMIISSWENSDILKDQYLDKNREYGDTYDFIVVGGGTAGSLVANRLSKSYKVLLLEAGGEPHPFHGIPLLANFMTGYPQQDWMHETTPQKNALFGMTGNIGLISGGKGLGGTSNLDYMMHLRGHPKDYDAWVKISGDPSWGYDALRPYFTRHEKYLGEWMEKGERGMHGTEGEIQLAHQTFSMLGKRFVVAGNEMGLPHVDLNGHYEQGFDMMIQPTKMGHRQTSYDAFLRRGKDRWNLVTEKYSVVNKILIRGQNHEAYAVEYTRHGKIRYAYSSKEIIISAGAINTPKLLLLSGIGDSNHLQDVGVPASVHLPGVGENLIDHFSVPIGPFFTDKENSIILERDIGPAALLSLGRGKGVLTSSGFEAVAMLTSDMARIKSGGDVAWPDIQLTLNSLGVNGGTVEDGVRGKRMRREVLSKYYEGATGKDSFKILVSGTRPRSRGEVKLRDPKPSSPVSVDPGYLMEIEDVGVLLDGVKKAMRLVEGTVMFQQIGARFTNRSVDGCDSYRHKSEEYWACYIRVMATSMGDVVGTAAIGSVVDNELRVIGTQRLRVMDASIMPTLVSGGTSAAVMAIAEKGADMLLKFWGPPDKVSSLAKESKTVGSILLESADKLRGLSSGSLFFQHIKDSPSYKEMVTGNTFTQKPGNPFRLIGPLLTASLTSAGEVEKKVVPVIPPYLQQYIQVNPSSYLTKPSQPPPPTATPLPLMSSLFSTDSTTLTSNIDSDTLKVEDNSAIVIPYQLQPKPTPHPYHGAFVSSVDSYISPYLKVPPPSVRFSKTLPILGFANVQKDGRNRDLSSLLHSSGIIGSNDNVRFLRENPMTTDEHLTAMMTFSPPPLRQPNSLLLRLLNTTVEPNGNDLASSVDSLLLAGMKEKDHLFYGHHSNDNLEGVKFGLLRLPMPLPSPASTERHQIKSLPFSKVLREYGEETILKSNQTPVVPYGWIDNPIRMGGSVLAGNVPLLLLPNPPPSMSFRFRILNQ